MQEKIIKELKELNKTMSSVRTFMIAEAQLMKSVLLELQKINKEVKNWHQ